ncbi:hypothetical protein IOD13_19260 [Brevibacterium casei]|nr:hypothetical protein [Brevibacterium casei]
MTRLAGASTAVTRTGLGFRDSTVPPWFSGSRLNEGLDLFGRPRLGEVSSFVHRPMSRVGRRCR